MASRNFDDELNGENVHTNKSYKDTDSEEEEDDDSESSEEISELGTDTESEGFTMPPQQRHETEIEEINSQFLQQNIELRERTQQISEFQFFLEPPPDSQIPAPQCQYITSAILPMPSQNNEQIPPPEDSEMSFRQNHYMPTLLSRMPCRPHYQDIPMTTDSPMRFSQYEHISTPVDPRDFLLRFHNNRAPDASQIPFITFPTPAVSLLNPPNYQNNPGPLFSTPHFPHFNNIAAPQAPQMSPIRYQQDIPRSVVFPMLPLQCDNMPAASIPALRFQNITVPSASAVPSSEYENIPAHFSPYPPTQIIPPVHFQEQIRFQEQMRFQEQIRFQEAIRFQGEIRFQEEIRFQSFQRMQSSQHPHFRAGQLLCPQNPPFSGLNEFNQNIRPPPGELYRMEQPSASNMNPIPRPPANWHFLPQRTTFISVWPPPIRSCESQRTFGLENTNEPVLVLRPEARNLRRLQGNVNEGTLRFSHTCRISPSQEDGVLNMNPEIILPGNIMAYDTNENLSSTFRDPLREDGVNSNTLPSFSQLKSESPSSEPQTTRAVGNDRQVRTILWNTTESGTTTSSSHAQSQFQGRIVQGNTKEKINNETELKVPWINNNRHKESAALSSSNVPLAPCPSSLQRDRIQSRDCLERNNLEGSADLLDLELKFPLISIGQGLENNKSVLHFRIQPCEWQGSSANTSGSETSSPGLSLKCNTSNSPASCRTPSIEECDTESEGEEPAAKPRHSKFS